MLARFLGHEHQQAERDDLWFAHGLASVEMLAAPFERCENALHLVAQADWLRIVIVESGETFQWGSQPPVSESVVLAT